ncbi:MAG: YegS/Rv2252/BmrU family lipid kinase [Candidatus Viridilinea halotolerans]|uniref:YegS/Rv2252/BmrU family lipid kinase n=1 Tax=Candidatus Viridilinea halotolerans TaxID=2491704 RepID=A0A426U095_9CHLR|nr:MAG: YegS/Rv2252/BmrU family lipid kinase [Candidatus Viridilinea halotolerans]
MPHEPQRAQKIFVVLNPVAGTSDSAVVRATLEQYLGGTERHLSVYETTGAADEDIPALVRAALDAGTELVVAAGGDGTVSLVAAALVGREAILGIVPTGTANVMAEVLALPTELTAAVTLLAADLTTTRVDGMRMGAQLGLLHISVGITSLMQRDTSRDMKRRFGRLAYIAVGMRWLLDFQPRRFMLVVDGQRQRLRASQILVANGGAMGQPPLSWGPHIEPDDGVIDICIINAKTFRGYLGVAWAALVGRQRRDERIRYLQARQHISINTKPSLPVQLDGELAGKTPVQIAVVPAAVRCVVGPDYVARRVTTPTSDELPALVAVAPVDAEEAQRVDSVTEVLRTRLNQVIGPDQARQVVDELLRLAAEFPASADEAGHLDERPDDAVRRAARQPGAAGIAGAIIETAAQLAAREDAQREALEQAAQRVTSPDPGVAPELAKPLQLLRDELLQRMKPYQAIDTRLFLAINQLPHPAVVNHFMYGLTSAMNGGLGWVAILLLAAALDRQRGPAALRTIAPPMWFAAMSVEYPIKNAFRRRRPFIDIVQAIAVGRKPGTYSFPSGHSAAAFAGAYLLSRHYPELRLYWYSLAALTGFSRIYLGVHYPGDVVAGAISGTALAAAYRLLTEVQL